MAVALLGAVMSLRKEENRPRLRRLAQVFVVLVLAWITLWGLYRFRFNESPAGLDLFNRPLAAKIADLHRPLLRDTVSLMARTHFMPRSYLWGLADILHVGVEGRVTPMFFMGRTYMQRAPFYFFPTVLLVKIPLGLIALALIGVVLATTTRDWPGREPLLVILLFGGLLLAMLIKGTSSYAGMRHALIVLPSIAVAGAAALAIALQRKSRLLLAGHRPCHRSGDGIGRPSIAALGVLQRTGRRNRKRLASSQRRKHGVGTKNQRACRLLPSISRTQREKFRTSNIRNPMPRTTAAESLPCKLSGRRIPRPTTSDVVSGTVMIAASMLPAHPQSDYMLDYTPLLATKPVQRFGNLMIFHGTYTLSGPRAFRLADRALDAEYSATPDLAKAELLMARSLEVNPKVYYRWIELGNILIQRGKRDEARAPIKRSNLCSCRRRNRRPC